MVFLEQIDMTAAEVRGRLVKLEAERALAHTTGLAEVRTYMEELEDQIELVRTVYVIAAVTEIATLRSELSTTVPFDRR
jgi:hypothetical protein